MEVSLFCKLAFRRRDQTGMTHEMIKRNLWPPRVIYEPPCISKDGRYADISSNHQVSEEKPFPNQGFTTVSGRYTHDGMVRGIEAKGGCRKTVRHQVYP